MADGSPKTALPTDLRPAFGALYRLHAPMVRRALRQLGVPPAQLEDATQDVFVVLHRRLDDYERGRSLTNWLWGIARGVASGYRRSARRRARLHEALPRPEAIEPLERGVARGEASAILDDFLGSLDADKCAVFVLSEIEGQRGPEIAERLDVNLNTVYARLRAARQRFDAAMERHHGSPSRPLFAWLPFAWPAWLSKPAVAVGVGALLTAVAVTGPTVEPEAAPTSEPTTVATAAIEREPASPAERPRAGVRRARVPRPELEPEIVIEDELEDEVLVLDEPAPRARPRLAPAPTSEAPAVVAREETATELRPELVTGPPPRMPWGSTVEAHQPVHHPELVTPRADFIDELWRAARRI